MEQRTRTESKGTRLLDHLEAFPNTAKYRLQSPRKKSAVCSKHGKPISLSTDRARLFAKAKLAMFVLRLVHSSKLPAPLFISRTKANTIDRLNWLWSSN
jgi:hypothetical protein